MIVSAAGAVDHDSFVADITNKLGGYQAKSEAFVPEPARYIGGDFREERDLMDAQVLIGFEGRAYHVKDYYASQLLSMILGGGMSSRLFQEVREKRGLCYSILFIPLGVSQIPACSVSMPLQVKKTCRNWFPSSCPSFARATQSITREELDRARAQYRAQPVDVGRKRSLPCRTDRTADHVVWQACWYRRIDGAIVQHHN